MKIFKHLILFVIIILVVGCISLIGAAYFSTINKESGVIALKGLHGKVIIQTDQYGISHVHALKNDEDAFFALGYLHARDRFWQMEFQRRIAEGSLSEVLGKAALAKDKFLRTWGFYRTAKKDWPTFDAKSKKIIRAYTKGVNAFLITGKLPLQFKILRYKPKPWTEVDSITWGKLMAFDLQTSIDQKIKAYQIAKYLGKKQINILLPPYPQNHPTILSDQDLRQSNLLAMRSVHKTPKQTLKQLSCIQNLLNKIRAQLGFQNTPGKGSNNWVISGRLTTTGKPLLASDPHLRLSAPGIWYLVELQGPKLHVIGATIPGLPTILIGHNDHIAWGITNVDPDTQDLYIIPKNAPLKTIHEIIKVKNQPDIDWPVKISSDGPIISDVGNAKKLDQQIALKWTALQPHDTTLASYLKINYAKNWQEFTDALKYFVAPSLNFVYADKQGNIGYYLSGRIPIRSSNNNILPIAPSQHLVWKGYIPFDKLPHVYNPKEGFIVTANNKVTSNRYPYKLNFRWQKPGFRAQRITDLINQLQPLSMTTTKQIQLDTISYLWKDLRTTLLNTKPLDQESQVCLNILKSWNGNMSLKSSGAAVFAFWYQALTEMFAKKIPFVTAWNEPIFIIQQLSSSRGLTAGSSYETSYFLDPAVKPRDDEVRNFLSKSLHLAANAVVNKLGKDPKKWQWGKLHHAYFNELGLGVVKPIGWIWNRSIVTPGGDYTVDTGSYDERTFHQISGSSYRQIIDLSNFNKSIYIQPIGQSDNPFSKYHSNLLLPWRNGKYLPMSSNKKDWGRTQKLVLTNAESSPSKN